MLSYEDQVVASEAKIKKFIDTEFDKLRKFVAGNFQNRTYATLWYRWGNGQWDFNHLEDGHVTSKSPTPKHPSHEQIWKGGKWAKAHVQLNPDNVVKPLLIFEG